MTVTCAGDAAEILRRWGAAVRNRRRALGLSQVELAEAAGLRQSTISGIELGVDQPTLTTRLQLAAALNVGHDDLFRVDGGEAA